MYGLGNITTFQKHANSNSIINVNSRPANQNRCIINQSINQPNFYSANIPDEARLSGATAKSVFNSKIEETVP